jgi:hypothetical protein
MGLPDDPADRRAKADPGDELPDGWGGLGMIRLGMIRR